MITFICHCNDKLCIINFSIKNQDLNNIYVLNLLFIINIIITCAMRVQLNPKLYQNMRLSLMMVAIDQLELVNRMTLWLRKIYILMQSTTIKLVPNNYHDWK